MNNEYIGIEIKIPELAKKYGLENKEALVAYNFFWSELKTAKSTFVHPKIFCKGLGTFELIYSRIDYVLDRLKRIKDNEILPPETRTQAELSIQNVHKCKQILDEQYHIRKSTKASNKDSKGPQGE